MPFKSRKFFITINNWSEEEYENCESLMPECSYSILAKEVGMENGLPHLHLWLHYEPNPRSSGPIQKLLKRANIQRGKGSDIDQTYLKKTEEEGGRGFIESGEPKEDKPGKRNDIQHVREIVQGGACLRECAMEATSYQSLKSAEFMLKLFERQRDWVPEVYWFWGAPGSGKTRAAKDLAPDHWISGKNLKWWEGYDAHEDVIIDDFRRDFCTFHELLRITDRYGYRVECKGGSRQLLAKRIFITCPFHWNKLWEGRSNEDMVQLHRRITETKLFGTEVVEQRSGVIINPDPSSSDDDEEFIEL